MADELGVKAAVLIHPTRMALTATTGGPPVFDLIEVMGRDATQRHLGNFARFLIESQPSAVMGLRPGAH